jgi:acetyl-CoA hydrolase
MNSGAATVIVAKLPGPVSAARADAGVVVTGFGVADLRGQLLRVRWERMLAIAHPDHRRALEKELEDEDTERMVALP